MDLGQREQHTAAVECPCALQIARVHLGLLPGGIEGVARVPWGAVEKLPGLVGAVDLDDAGAILDDGADGCVVLDPIQAEHRDAG